MVCTEISNHAAATILNITTIFFLLLFWQNIRRMEGNCCGSNFSLVQNFSNPVSFLFSFVSEYDNEYKTKESKIKLV